MSQQNRELTVLVDMDGVLADFEQPNNRLLEAFHPEVPIDLEARDFYFKDRYAQHEGVADTIYRENRQPGFFQSFPVVDGAIEGWQRLLDAGYRPRVCSSPLEDHPTCISEKRAWLGEHLVPVFGSWVVDTAIFNRDKSSYEAIALIDDRPSVRNGEHASWQHIVFARSYNRDVQHLPRLEGWQDPALEPLLAQAAQNYVMHRRGFAGSNTASEM